jgi:hypothetical protein
MSGLDITCRCCWLGQRSLGGDEGTPRFIVFDPRNAA